MLLLRVHHIGRGRSKLESVQGRLDQNVKLAKDGTFHSHWKGRLRHVLSHLGMFNRTMDPKVKL